MQWYVQLKEVPISTADQVPGFTDEEILEQAQGNATATGLALFRYAREQGNSPKSAARWLGAIFAPRWEEVRGQGARQAAHWAALNSVSLGAKMRELVGDERQASATVTGWPGDDVLGFFGLSLDEADATFDVFASVAEYVGLQYSWERHGDSVTMTFTDGSSRVQG